MRTDSKMLSDQYAFWGWRMKQWRTIRTPTARNPSCFNMMSQTMNTIIQIIFTSILSAVAPTFANAAYLQSHAPYQQNARHIEVAYFVDQTKAWALEAHAQDVMNKVTRDKTSKPQVSTFE